MHTTDIQFREIDSAVMDCSYNSQNKFGRLFDERIYENDVAARLHALGFVAHGNPAKHYGDLDLEMSRKKLESTGAIQQYMA